MNKTAGISMWERGHRRKKRLSNRKAACSVHRALTLGASCCVDRAKETNVIKNILGCNCFYGPKIAVLNLCFMTPLGVDQPFHGGLI